ncbi:hypothetical protein WDW86_06040 [Bdellovibrionota bacterium FG-2]
MTIERQTSTNGGIDASGGTKEPGTFNWNQYLDPKNKEFFKEGDYTPPEAFMEIVRNPTDENLKLWFAYNDKKNQLSDRLQARMKEYIEKYPGAKLPGNLGGPPSGQLGGQLENTGRSYLQAKANALPKAEPDAKRFRFRMYFDSHCPHCKKMFGTLTELQERGFMVEARQVDNDPRGLEGLSIPAVRATPDELREKSIQNVPLLLVGDLTNKTVYRIPGYQSVSSIFQTIASQGGK